MSNPQSEADGYDILLEATDAPSDVATEHVSLSEINVETSYGQGSGFEEAVVSESIEDKAETDPVFEATVEIFRKTGFPIHQEDDTYVVMQFMHTAMRNTEKRLMEERRAEVKELVSEMKVCVAAIDRAIQHNAELIDAQNTNAKFLGERLMATAAVAAKKFDDAARAIREEAQIAMSNQAEAEFTGQLRSLVREETRIGLAGGTEIEMKVLSESVTAAASMLERASSAAAARAGKGWLLNVVEDFKQLPQKVQVGIGVGAAILLLLVFL